MIRDVRTARDCLLLGQMEFPGSLRDHDHVSFMLMYQRFPKTITLEACRIWDGTKCFKVHEYDMPYLPCVPGFSLL